MGHYDDCFEANQDKQRRDIEDQNKATHLKMVTEFRQLESLIGGLHIEDSWREHLNQRLRELKALSKFYIS